MKTYVNFDQLPTEEELKQLEKDMISIKQRVQKFKISLSLEERRFQRKMGNRRVAYVQVGERLSDQYEQRMPRDFEVSYITKLLGAHIGLRRFYSHLEEVQENTDDTLMAYGIDAMKLVKVVHDTLRTANKLDPSLDNALRELDEFYKRAQAEEAEEENNEELEPEV